MSPAARRALGLVAVGVLVAVVCTFLGRWQWHRHEWRDAQIAVVEANYDATPVPLADVLDGVGDALTDDEAWTPVRVSGRYDAGSTVLLRNRPVDGRPVYHVLVPFVLDRAGGGSAGAPPVLVVDRGWVAVGEDASSAVDVPPPPAGDVTLTVRLRAGEAPGRPAPAGYTHAIAVDQVLAQGGAQGSAYRAYGSLVAEDPAPTTPLGALAAPSLDPGSHLSYAFQWWVFALGALVGFSLLARREITDARAVEADGAPDPAAPPAPAPRRGRRDGRAEAEEDALIDAQLAEPGGR
ncbi:SURF1 family protein [Cellulomonas massiliensis]|uniref:SURF1 family cytochrome oxidase biogenesis protein n=1 Tax=Cellulomonas massiliensis TaxID=1465811 RepID=UPI0002E7E914|nr:SURF1 family protein [Cellulomonas massiliensis]